jgi:glycyl-tRNA synthetase beta subunit
MATTVKQLIIKLSEIKRLSNTAIKEYEDAIAAQNVIEEKVSTALFKIADLSDSIDELKEQLNSAVKHQDYQNAVIAMKSIRTIIYCKDDWFSSLGDAFRDLCKTYGWCSQCSFDSCEPRFPSSICEGH